VVAMRFMAEPSKEELLHAPPGSIDSDSLAFPGARGDRRRHLSRSELESAIAALPPAPRDRGTVDLLVARGSLGERHLPEEALLTVEGGMPGDRWASEGRYGPDFQLATTRSDFARVIANGQPPELHGDNLHVTLDLSSENLPAGSLLRLGEVLVRVTPQPHNGCKKWVQRFGFAPMQMNLASSHRHLRLRGIYFCVVTDGLVRNGDEVLVVSRTTHDASP
jgi:hypothetical protein